MNILYINHYAGSPELGMEYRPYYLSKEWIKNGHNVLIVAASNAHVRNIQFDLISNFEYKKIDSIDYLFIKTPKYYGNGLGRIKNMFSFLWRLHKYSRKISEIFKPDVVIASSTYPLDIYPARKIAKLYNAKLVFEVHDLWPLSPMELGGYSKYHPFIMVMQRGENFAYKYADKVVSMLPCALEHMISHGMKKEKFIHISNGIDIEEWKNSNEKHKPTIEFIRKLKKDNKKIVLYLGGHAISNALIYLIEAAKKLQNTNIDFLLIGKGVEKKTLLTKVNNENITNVHFIDYINKRAIPSVLAEADALYIGWTKNPLYRFGVSPNKIFDYMMASKPIIHSIEAGNDIVKDANCGISVEPENPEKISEAINQLLSKSDDELMQLGKNGYEYVLNNHDYSVLAQKFIDSIQKI